MWLTRVVFPRQIGQVVSEMAGKQLKRVSMELGGKSPSIIFDDADRELIIRPKCNSFN